jgi:uncharacterized protein YfiM (DUF2279 family)
MKQYCQKKMAEKSNLFFSLPIHTCSQPSSPDKFLLLLYILFTLLATAVQAQFSLYDTIRYQQKKVKHLAISGAAIYTGSMATLNQVWYAQNPRQSFEFFNDNHEWRQVDKIGHFYSAFYISAVSGKALNNCGVSAKKSAALGVLIGFTSLLTIEIFDGYSAAYGASGGDLLANATGSSLYWAQQQLWHEVRIYPKFSFHQTKFAPMRPSLLGDTWATEILKDYNGQTYWLSVDVDKFITFPKWLNIAAGYGAEQMIYANDEQNIEAGFHPYRQYYLSIDFDLTSIRTRSKFLRGVFTVLSAIKLPAPAIEFSKQGVQLKPFYF